MPPERRGHKTFSKHKSDGALGIKSTIAEGGHPCFPLFRMAISGGNMAEW